MPISLSFVVVVLHSPNSDSSHKPNATTWSLTESSCFNLKFYEDKQIYIEERKREKLTKKKRIQVGEAKFGGKSPNFWINLRTLFFDRVWVWVDKFESVFLHVILNIYI